MDLSTQGEDPMYLECSCSYYPMDCPNPLRHSHRGECNEQGVGSDTVLLCLQRPSLTVDVPFLPCSLSHALPGHVLE
eukprot:686032-Hanusia_phi.AAC.1